MKNKLYISAFGLLLLFGTSCKQKKEVEVVEEIKELTYTNPILSGFYPDPSICKVGDDYYLTTSSFGYFPGLPLFHSKDLVHWNQIGHILDRGEQLNLEGQGSSRGLFAPAIAHDGEKFYAICTNVDYKGNFVVTAENPEGPWSNPTWLPEISGIDPSIHFEDDGTSYIVYNSDPPDNVSLYSGHRTIKMVAFDKENLKVISEPEIIVNGGTDLAKEPIWIEAPHVYKKDDWYYLMCAEGGTSWDHSEVIFRSKTVTGPYIPLEANPILTQRDLDSTRENPIGCAGHADMVIGPDGNWWAVFLATRPYEGKHYNIGRETFLLPVSWENDWPTILPKNTLIPYVHTAPKVSVSGESKIPIAGNYEFLDTFKDLHFSWTYLRNPKKENYRIKDETLEMDLSSETVGGSSSPSFIAKRQTSHYGSVSSKMDFNPLTAGEQAGMVLYQNENHYYFLCKELANSKPVVSLYAVSGDSKSKIASKDLLSAEESVFLKIDFKGKHIDFSIGASEDAYSILAENQDATILSTETGGGFVGTMIGLYGSSNGTASKNTVSYDWFKMVVDEEIYK